MLINYKYISRIKSDMVWYKTGRESEEVPVSIARRYSRNSLMALINMCL